ncbi:V-snare-domain-containing protein [Cubamyces sp. BRFM 1775]|nr:V-snare-domain-containing protein [Cubamyces sp. BRFM 1775]
MADYLCDARLPPADRGLLALTHAPSPNSASLPLPVLAPGSVTAQNSTRIPPCAAMSNYDSLHRQCRTLESLFDTKLTAYARLASSITRNHDDVEASGSTERWRDLEAEVDELLEKLQEINDQLSAVAEDSENPPSQSMLRAIQRHREVYLDYARELRRTKGNVKTALDQANLLSGVRNDIDAYKSSAADSLLAERGHIDNSHRMTDDMLAQAYETRAEFARQRTTISGINARMQGVLSSMPGINNLLSMIKTRRRRDAVIIGCLIGVCMVLLFMYMF